MKRLCFLCLLLTACEQEPEYHVQDEFKPYVEAFELAAQQRGVTFQRINLTVHYEAGLYEKENALGVTHKRLGSRVVGIEPRWVDELRKQGRLHRLEPLIFHELGHALLNQDHRDSSIMTTKGNGQLFEDDHGQVDSVKRAWYLDELFSH